MLKRKKLHMRKSSEKLNDEDRKLNVCLPKGVDDDFNSEGILLRYISSFQSKLKRVNSGDAKNQSRLYGARNKRI